MGSQAWSCREFLLCWHAVVCVGKQLLNLILGSTTLVAVTLAVPVIAVFSLKLYKWDMFRKYKNQYGYIIVIFKTFERVIVFTRFFVCFVVFFFLHAYLQIWFLLYFLKIIFEQYIRKATLVKVKDLPCPYFRSWCYCMWSTIFCKRFWTGFQTF